MKRPAAAKRKVEELEDFGPETEVVAGSGGMVQIPEEGIDDKAKSEKKAKKGKTAEEQEGEADDDKAKNGKKSKKGRTAEEKEVLDSLPDLESYRVLQLAIETHIIFVMAVCCYCYNLALR